MIELRHSILAILVVSSTVSLYLSLIFYIVEDADIPAGEVLREKVSQWI